MKRAICSICFSALITVSFCLFSCSSDKDGSPSPAKTWSYVILHPEGKCWYSTARAVKNGKIGGTAVYDTVNPTTGTHDKLFHAAYWASISAEGFLDLGDQGRTMPSTIHSLNDTWKVGYQIQYGAFWPDNAYPPELVPNFLGISSMSNIMGVCDNWAVGDAYTVYNQGKAALWRLDDDNPAVGYDLTPAEIKDVPYSAAWAMAIDGATEQNPGVVVGGAPISCTSAAILWENIVINGEDISFNHVNLHPSNDYETSDCWAVYGDQQGGFVKEWPDVSVDSGYRAALWEGTPESFKNLHPDIEGVKNSRIRGMADGVQVGEIFYGDDLNEGPPSHAFLWFGSADEYVDLHGVLPDNYSNSSALGMEKIGEDIYVVGYAVNEEADVGGRQEAIVWIYSASKQHVLSGSDWKEATSSAQFPVRQDFATLVFNDKLWVIGGSDHLTIYSDVWYSSDGATWTEATASAAFGKRFAHSSVVFDDRMWVIGGIDGNGNSRNDVWYSTDGVTWIEANASAGFTPRYAHSSASDYGHMWVIGGRSGDDAVKDVWVSTDGTTWSAATLSAEFPARQNHASVYFNNRIWVVGGISTPLEENIMLGDVWYSGDGETWTKAVEGAFEGRDATALVAAGGRMWMLGGFMNPHDRVNEVWYSTNGETWAQVTTTSDFTARCMLGGAYFDKKLWVIAGQTGPSTRVNDVWYAE